MQQDTGRLHPAFAINSIYGHYFCRLSDRIGGSMQQSEITLRSYSPADIRFCPVHLSLVA